MTERVTFHGEHGPYERWATPLVMPGSARIYSILSPANHLYKEFPEPLARIHVERVRSLVEIGRAVRAGRIRSTGARRIVWPVDLVATSDAVEGVVMPRASDAFFRPANGLTELTQSFSYLVGADHPAAAARLEIVRQLAEALAMLDRYDLVHGDVSASNVLWCAAPRPGLLLIDADGIHPAGFPVDPAGTPHWDDPRRNVEIHRHDKRSDWYALALAVYRAAVIAQRVDPASDGHALQSLPSGLAQPLSQVFADPLDGEARVRPAKWRAALAGVVGDADACAAIDTAFGGPRGSVRERRGRGPAKAAGAKRVRPAQPRPRQRRPAPSSPRPSVRTRPPVPSPSVDRTRRNLLVAAVAIALVAVGALALALHHGAAANTAGSAAARNRLISALPDSFTSCDADPGAPSGVGVTAAVHCRADDRTVAVYQFATRAQLDDYTTSRAAQTIEGDPTAPSQCSDNGGTWTYDNDRSHPAGILIYSTGDSGARFEWSLYRDRLYYVSSSSDGDLGALCSWWVDLPL